jgi:hypothetical protein
MQIGNRQLRRNELRSLFAGVGLLARRVCQKQSASHALRQLPGNFRSASEPLRKERPHGHSLLASGYRWCAGSEKAANSACASFAAIGVEPLYVFGNGSSITVP